MKIIANVGLVVLGLIMGAIFFWIQGSLVISSDFAANVVGASIGGLISVGLALFIFDRERRDAKADALQKAHEQREEAIRQALRHIRAIRECITGGYGFNINTSQRIRGNILQSSSLARKALEDINLTDFPLRQSIEDAALIGNDTAASLISQLDAANLQDANITLPAAEQICDSAVSSLNQLMDDYKRIRAIPAS